MKLKAQLAFIAFSAMAFFFQGTIDAQDIGYVPGIPVEVRPNVFIEQGTKIEKSCKKRKMQKMALTYAEIWATANSDLAKSLSLLEGITSPDSHLYFPTGYLTSRDQIRDNIIAFAAVALDVSVWIPANGWCFDTSKKYGKVNSSGQLEYYHLFTVEVQFRQTRASRVRPEVTNDTWAFFVDEKVTHFYQAKEWLDGRVRSLQNENVDGTPTLILDYNNNNVTPWPPVYPGKELHLFPITVHSGWITS